MSAKTTVKEEPPMIIKPSQSLCASACAPVMATGRYSPHERAEIYAAIVKRDGHICRAFFAGYPYSKNCKATLPKYGKFDIDHIDGDKSHNCIENLQLLCAPCNQKKKELQARTKMFNQPFAYQDGLQPYVCAHLSATASAPDAHSADGEGDSTTLPVVEPVNMKKAQKVLDAEIKKPDETPSMRANRDNQPRYRNCLWMLVLSGEQVTTRRAIYGLAKRLEIPSATCKRYFLEETDPDEGDLMVHPTKKVVMLRTDRVLTPEQQKVAELSEQLRQFQAAADAKQKDSYHAFELLQSLTNKSAEELQEALLKARRHNGFEYPICILCNEKRAMVRGQYVCSPCQAKFKEASDKQRDARTGDEEVLK